MPRTDIYGGACGRTRTEPTHYSCRCGAVLAVEVHRSVNATRDPGLGARLREGLERTIPWMRDHGLL